MQEQITEGLKDLNHEINVGQRDMMTSPVLAVSTPVGERNETEVQRIDR